MSFAFDLKNYLGDVEVFGNVSTTPGFTAEDLRSDFMSMFLINIHFDMMLFTIMIMIQFANDISR